MDIVKHYFPRYFIQVAGAIGRKLALLLREMFKDLYKISVEKAKNNDY